MHGGEHQRCDPNGDPGAPTLLERSEDDAPQGDLLGNRVETAAYEDRHEYGDEQFRGCGARDRGFDVGPGLHVNEDGADRRRCCAQSKERPRTPRPVGVEQGAERPALHKAPVGERARMEHEHELPRAAHQGQPRHGHWDQQGEKEADDSQVATGHGTGLSKGWVIV